jgi:hypothetical protein
MNPGAGVTDLAALHDWHVDLTEFKNEAVNSLAMLALGLARMSEWLETQHRHWSHEIRKAEDDISQAATELRHRRMSMVGDRPPDCTVQEDALRKAKARLAEAEERLAAVRAWTLRLPEEIREICDPSTRELGMFVDLNLARALAALDRQMTALDRYASSTPPDAPSLSRTGDAFGSSAEPVTPGDPLPETERGSKNAPTPPTEAT